MPYTFKKHGQFVVTVRATNSAGHFDASTEVTVLGRLLSPGGRAFLKAPKIFRSRKTNLCEASPEM